MNTKLRYFLRFIGGSIGFIFFIVLSKNCVRSFDANWGSLDLSIIITLVLLTAGEVFALYQIILSGLYLLILGKRPSPSIVTFLKNGISKSMHDVYQRRLSSSQRNIISLGSWSLFIFLFVCMLASLQLFEKRETFFLAIGPVRHLYQKELPWKLSGQEGYDKYLAEEPVRYFEFMSADNNSRQYLQDLYKIAKDLKDAGAKAVVADVPTGLHGSNSLRELYSKIDSLKIVVWGGEWASGTVKYFPQNVSTRLDKLDYQNVYSLETGWSKPSSNFQEWTIVRWHPLMKHSTGSRWLTQIDVAVLVAKRYFNMADTSILSSNGNAVVVNDLNIPVTSAGTAYSDNANRLFHFSVSASRGVGGPEGFEFNPDSLRYNAQVEIAKGVSVTSQKDTVKTLTNYKYYFTGKVVVINWMYSTPTDFFAKLPLANVISNVLRNRFYAKHEALTYLLSIITILSIAISSARYRIRWVIYTSLFLAAGVFVFAVWVFLSFRVLFDPLYPLLAIILSVIIFSLLKMSREIA